MESVKSRKSFGYILRKYPVLSETFILNELLELEALGAELHIFSLERPNDPRFHENLHKLKAHVTYVPDLLKLKSLWKHRKSASRNFGKGYRQALWYAFRHFNPSLALRFLQGCYIANAAKKLSIAHFHSHFATRSTSAAFFASMISEIPYSFTAHAVDIFKQTLSQKALQKKMEHAKFVVTVSEYNKNYLSDLSQKSSHKIYKIHNGIDLEKFQSNGANTQSPFTFLCVARFVEKKGHKVLLDACGRLREEGLQFQCLLVGKGKLQKKIETIIQEKQLQDYVQVLGPHTHEEVLSRYHQSHAYVLPCQIGSDGNRDGLPVAIVEALACGLPVITTPMTGNPEVVKHGHNGLLVPFNDANATAMAMRSMMCEDNLYPKLQSNCRPSVLDKFDLGQTTGSLVKLFMGGAH